MCAWLTAFLGMLWVLLNAQSMPGKWVDTVQWNGLTHSVLILDFKGYLAGINSFSAEFETESTASLGVLWAPKTCRGKLSTWTIFLPGTTDFRLGMMVLVGKVSS